MAPGYSLRIQEKFDRHNDPKIRSTDYSAIGHGFESRLCREISLL